MSAYIPQNDQENRINVTSGDSRIVNGEKSRAQAAKTSSRFARVPLGGKQQNTVHGFNVKSHQNVPLLGKSYSTINTNKVTKLFRAPSLLKSNSSLGFIHKQDIAPVVPKQKSKVILKKLNSQWLHPNGATRHTQLVERNLVSDNLQKKTGPELEKITSLNDTVFPTQLQPENIKCHDINKYNVDPVKKHHIPTQDTFNEFFKVDKIKVPQHLIDDPNSVEAIPERKPTKQYHPHGIEPLSQGESLEFFSTLSNKPKHDDEVPLEDLECDMDFSINGNNHNEPQINNIEENLGLSVEELNELLD
jgi:hypothetical protein